MEINKLALTEGGVFTNLTLAPNPTFPENGNLGQLTSIDGKFYHHDASMWRNIPSKQDVLDLINDRLTNGKFISFKTLLNSRVWINGRGGGNFWAQNGFALTAVTVGVGVNTLPMLYYDPADYPVGTKFRVSINTSVNAANTSPTTVVTIGFCKVLRPASAGGAGNLVIYTPESPDVVNMEFLSLPARSMQNHVTEEFFMPNEPGLYAFRIQLSTSNNSSTCHYDINLQAKY
jgi:hypothetical protein